MQLNNKTLFSATIISTLLCIIFYVPGYVSACTIGVASGNATADGRPLLWKSRDVSNYNQEFHYCDDGPIPFISVTYSGITDKYYGGVNAAGFAIGNSDSYNLGPSSGFDDGRIHKKALETCSTVDDFQYMLDSLTNIGLLLNSNYAVIDAFGGAAMFECATYSYTRFNASEEGGFIVRANYSYSGDMSNHDNLVSWGLFRHDRAYSLWNAAVNGGETSTLTQQYIFRHVVRDLAIEGTDPYPLPFDGQIDDYPYGCIPNAQAICRNKTRSVVVVQGVPADADPDDAVLWTMCGNPLASVPLPLWVRAGSVPVEFDGNDGSPICDRGAELADWICDYVNPDSVVNTWKLTNPLENGLWDDIFPWSDGVFAQVNSFTSSEDYNDDNLVEAFQNDMATLIYDDLVAWQPSGPVWTSVPETVTGDENTLIEFNVSGISSYNEALTIAFNRNGLPETAQFTDNHDGTGSFSWQTTFDDAGNYIPIFTLSDGASTVDASVTITVNDVNRAPEWTSVPEPISANEGDPIAFTITGSDPEGDPLTITLDPDGLPEGFVFNDHFDGTADFSWLTAEGDAGDYTATFTISDGNLSDVAVVPITVLGAPEPEISYASSEETLRGTVQGDYTNTTSSNNIYEILTERESGGRPANRHSYLEHIWTFEITGYDLELHAEAHRSANEEVDDFILAGSFDGQNYTDLVTVTKTADDNAEQIAAIIGDAAGTYYMRVTDTDRTSGNRVLDSFYMDHLSISYMTGDVPNRAPIWTDVPVEITGYAGDPIEFTVTGTDPDGDNLNISLATDVPEGYNFTDNGDGSALFSWQTAVDDLGNYTATFTISDGELTDITAVPIHVVEAPEPGTMYVSAINLTENVINKNFTTCTGVITVLDLSDAAVEGALVSATWSGLYTADVQGATDGNGQVTFVTENMRRPNGLLTLTITDVTKADWTYDVNENIVTEAELGFGDYAAGWGYLTLNPGAPIPEVAILNPTYPNPFNYRATIRFGLPEDARVRITIYDIMGRRVATLVNRYAQAGWYSTIWTPGLLANGEYIVRLESDRFVKTRRLVFLK